MSQDQNQLSAIHQKLKDAGGATAQAQQELVSAQNAVARAAKDLAFAQIQVGVQQAVVAGLVDKLRNLLPHFLTSENRQRAVDMLGLDVGEGTLDDFKTALKSANSVRRQAGLVWQRVKTTEGGFSRLAWAGGAALVAWLFAKVAAAAVPEVKAFLLTFSVQIKLCVELLIAAIASLKPTISAVRKAIGELDRWEVKAEEVQRQRLTDPDVVHARKTLAEREAAVATAAAQATAAKENYDALLAAADELHPERRMRRFIEDRAKSKEYRGQLGLVSLVRRDFQKLSEIFAETTPPVPADGVVATTPQPVGAKRVDRIVLFIDDLDRCQPEKVAEVLQAVHLLLAFPLFTVIVGVDQRCLKQSLRLQFPGLLGNENGAGGSSGTETRSATALDYLEKIFHVPLHLPAMNRAGFSVMIERLAQPQAESATESKVGPRAESLMSTVVQPLAAVEIKADEITAKDKNAKTSHFVGSIRLKIAETSAMKEYSALVRTPRAATRLLNTYRLIRAGVEEQDWPRFRGSSNFDGECRLAMLLLAGAAGSPSRARDWFKLLRKCDPSAFVVDERLVANTDGAEFFSLCKSTLTAMPRTPSSSELNVWLDRVEQFTF